MLINDSRGEKEIHVEKGKGEKYVRYIDARSIEGRISNGDFVVSLGILLGSCV